MRQASWSWLKKKSIWYFKMTIILLSCRVDIFISILHCSKLFKMVIEQSTFFYLAAIMGIIARPFFFRQHYVQFARQFSIFYLPSVFWNSRRTKSNRPGETVFRSRCTIKRSRKFYGNYWQLTASTCTVNFTDGWWLFTVIIKHDRAV